MQENNSYKTAKNLSLMYVICIIFDLCISGSIIGSIFVTIIFPIILIQLKRYLFKEYDFKFGFIFNVLIIMFVISTVLVIIGSVIFSTLVDISRLSSNQMNNNVNLLMNHKEKNIIFIFAYFIEALLIIRGIVEIGISTLIMKKYKELKIGLKISLIFLLVLGINTIVTGVIALIPSLLQILPHQETMIILNVLKYSMPFIMLFLFGGLYWEFKSGSLKSNTEELNQIGE